MPIKGKCGKSVKKADCQNPKKACLGCLLRPDMNYLKAKQIQSPTVTTN